MKALLFTSIGSVLVALALNLYTQVPYFWLGFIIILPIFICYAICNSKTLTEHRDNSTKFIIDELDKIVSQKLAEPLQGLQNQINKNHNAEVETLKVYFDQFASVFASIKDTQKALNTNIGTILKSMLTLEAYKTNSEQVSQQLQLALKNISDRQINSKQLFAELSTFNSYGKQSVDSLGTLKKSQTTLNENVSGIGNAMLTLEAYNQYSKQLSDIIKQIANRQINADKLFGKLDTLRNDNQQTLTSLDHLIEGQTEHNTVLSDIQKSMLTLDGYKIQSQNLGSVLELINKKQIEIQKAMLTLESYNRKMQELLNAIQQLTNKQTEIQKSMLTAGEYNNKCQVLINSLKNINDKQLNVQHLSNATEKVTSRVNSLSDLLRQQMQQLASTTSTSVESLNKGLKEQIQKTSKDISDYQELTVSETSKMVEGIKEFKDEILKYNTLYQEHIKTAENVITALKNNADNQCMQINKRLSTLFSDLTDNLEKVPKKFDDSIYSFNDSIEDFFRNTTEELKDSMDSLNNMVKDLELEIGLFDSCVKDVNNGMVKFQESFDALKVEERKLTKDEENILRQLMNLK